MKIDWDKPIELLPTAGSLVRGRFAGLRYLGELLGTHPGGGEGCRRVLALKSHSGTNEIAVVADDGNVPGYGTVSNILPKPKERWAIYTASGEFYGTYGSYSEAVLYCDPDLQIIHLMEIRGDEE